MDQETGPWAFRPRENVSSVLALSQPALTDVISALDLLTGSGSWCGSRAGVMQERQQEKD